MNKEAPQEEYIYKYFREKGVREFPVLGIGRQGFRSAVEVLADALVREGKYVQVGARLSGARSYGINIITLRFADISDIPTGFYPIYPDGLLAAHESFLSPDVSWRVTPGVSRSISALGESEGGTLMVCTPKPPESIECPLDFEGTVATVDAEAIFSERVAIQPAPYGITALGLFVRATGLVSLDAVKQSILEFERLRKKVRELNVETAQKAFEETKVLRDVKIKGKFSKDEYKKYEETLKTPAHGVVTTKLLGAAGDEPAYAWREQLPVCDQRKCKCIECLAAYYCPEGAISWKDELYHVDYDFCKGCGTCAQECTEDAVHMEDAEKVLANLGRK